MFFIGGISSKSRQLEFYQSLLCSHCKKYVHYEAFIEFMYFSLFFIPIFKWNKKYYVKSTCCGAIYTINSELGERIARGENITLEFEDLEIVQEGQIDNEIYCPQCGYEIDQSYKYCPNCAEPLK